MWECEEMEQMDNYIKEEKKKYIQEDQVLRLSHKRERERGSSIFFITIIPHHFPIYAHSNLPWS